jgi:hypothetical protein
LAAPTSTPSPVASQEADLVEVDDQGRVGGQQRQQEFAQLGGGGEVEFPGRGDDGAASLAPDVHCQLVAHGCSPSLQYLPERVGGAGLALPVISAGGRAGG